MRNYIEICKIVNTHGINGAVKAEPWCDSPAVLAGMKALYLAPARSGEEFTPVEVIKASVQKEFVLLTVRGIDTIEKANTLRGKVLYADRNDIPLADGAFLIDDLIGMQVIDNESGHIYGKLSDVIQGGAGDIYEIDCGGKKALIPAVKEFVKRIEIGSGIFISPIKGMFDED